MENEKIPYSEFRYYLDLYKETFGTSPRFHINETREIEKMKKAIETGEKYDLDEDPDYPGDDDDNFPYILVE